MAYQDILFRLDGPVARISVDRPEKLNALANRTADELRLALAEAEREGARAVLLTGEGRAFGAGYDLSSVEAAPELDMVLRDHFNPLIRAMRESPLPIVSAVQGACAGVSVALALAADVVIAARSAYFLQPFVGIALVPDGGNTLFLSQLAGRIRGGAAMLLGERVPAEEAERWGLLWRLVEDDTLAAEAEAIAARLAAQPPQALAATKRLIRDAAEPGLDDALLREEIAQGIAGRGQEMQHAIRRFLEKRS